MTAETALADALSPLVQTLAADGYEARYFVADGVLKLEVSAGEGACEDCLSPKPIMSRIVESSLAKAGIELHVELRYPTDPVG